MVQLGALIGLGLASWYILRLGGVTPFESTRRIPSPWVLPGQGLFLSMIVIAAFLLLLSMIYELLSRITGDANPAILGAASGAMTQLVILAVLWYFRAQAVTPLLQFSQQLSADPGQQTESPAPPRGEWGSKPPDPNQNGESISQEWYDQPEMALRASATPRRPLHQLVSQSYLWFLVALSGAFVVGVIWALLLRSMDIEPDSQAAVREITATDNPWMILLLVLSVVVLAPLWEEIFFRGIVLRHGSQYIGFWPALIFSSALFSMAHFLVVGIPGFIVLGMVFGLAYRATGTLLTPILMHAFFNLNTVVYLRLYGRNSAETDLLSQLFAILP